jgi:DNA-binding transcriptional MocR family regulator
MSVLIRYPIGGSGASQIVDSVERGVREGKLHPGAALPTVRALSRDLKLSPATVAAAYRALRQRGLVTSDGRRGTRIGQRPPVNARRPATRVPEGLRDLASGNPNPRFFPSYRDALAKLKDEHVLYGEPAEDPELLELARKQFEKDDIDARHLAVLGGALDGIERVLQAHLRPGDRVAVEDPGHAGILDLIAALGFVPEPMPLDDFGPLPDAARQALRRGAQALILTPRAQNPTGAALDERRTKDLGKALDDFPAILLIEDDHAGPVAGTDAFSLTKGRQTWAVARSVSKSLGPDLRVALLAGDAETIARVQGRQYIGAGWVSHVLQRLVAALWKDTHAARLMRGAERVYGERRTALIEALRARGIPAFGRSGMNVWIPAAEEAGPLTSLAALGWAVRAGEPYRIRSGPAIRVTIESLREDDVARLASDIASAVRPGRRTVTV